MSNSFVYVTYIRTTPEKLWEALTEPEFHRQYFLGARMQSDWKKGSSWKLIFADGRVTDSGEILEIDPPKRLVIKWRNEFMPEVKADGYTRCTFTIEQEGEHDEARRHPRGGRSAQTAGACRQRLAAGPVQPEEPARDRQGPVSARRRRVEAFVSISETTH